MNLLTTGVKALATTALTTMRHYLGGGRGSWFGMLRRTRYDYRKEVGNGLDSSVVTAPIQWIQRALPEARLTVQLRKRDESVEDQPDHPMLALIARPNPYYDDIALLGATVMSLLMPGGGSAFWIKARNGYARPAELWWVPHWTMKPVSAHDGSDFISYWLYSPGGVAPMRIPVEDVVHFRMGINPDDPRLGISPMDATVREIFMDLESSNLVASLLRNMGIPGVVISPKTGVMPGPDEVAATKTYVDQNFGGDRRGSTMVMSGPTDVQQFGFNPQQLEVSGARDIAEERVCACVGVPAAVVGFGAGLQTAKVGATMEELVKLAWRSGVLPIGRIIAGGIERSLLPDFGAADRLSVLFDTDDVLALQEDEDKRVERLGKQLATGAITVFEYRTQLGMTADDSHKFYLRPISAIETPEGLPPRLDPPEPGKSRGTKARASRAGYKRGQAYALILQRQARGLEAAMQKRLAPHFARWGKAAAEAARPLLEEPKNRKDDDEGDADETLIQAVLKKLDVPTWAAALAQEYGAHFLAVAKAQDDAAERAGLGANLPDPVGRAIVASGGRRAGLVDIDKQTRDALFEALAEGRAEGEGVDQLAARIEEYVEAGPWNDEGYRAQLIARTETKFAQNISTIERAKAAGVERFVVFDGRLGPGRSIQEHMDRDGSIVTAEEADQMADEEHPNGTLSFAPYFEE